MAHQTVRSEDIQDEKILCNESSDTRNSIIVRYKNKTYCFIIFMWIYKKEIRAPKKATTTKSKEKKRRGKIYSEMMMFKSVKMRAILVLINFSVCVFAITPVVQRPGAGNNNNNNPDRPRLPRTSASQFPKNATSRSSTTKPTFRTRWAFYFFHEIISFFLSCFKAFLLSWHYATLMHSAPVRNCWYFMYVLVL